MPRSASAASLSSMPGIVAIRPLPPSRTRTPSQARSTPRASRRVHGWYWPMARNGSVKLSSFTSPRTPNAPCNRPTVIIRWRLSGAFMGAAPPASRAAAASGGLGGLLVVVGDLVGELRTVVHPELHALEVQLDALLGALRDRVVETHAFDVAAVARAAAVGDDDMVEGTLLGAATGKANLDHCSFSVLPSGRN